LFDRAKTAQRVNILVEVEGPQTAAGVDTGHG
jgi:hypothetical protein